MSSTTRRSMHVNSLAAYEAGRRELFSKRELLILDALRGKAPATDRDVMHALGFADMNSVRPRITELVKDGVLVELDSVRDRKTGKWVRTVQTRKVSQQTELSLAGGAS